ncbi:MAG: type I restriction enzyme HsdR N-terminal domain-containing protein, partial [Treponema sp.]|nr:type I restriction enzyme HsdR N-terminal domain-containing protein [Treponema sp.]
YAIRGTYCDLAIIGSNKKIRFLVEVKAVSVTLNDNHVKQAIDYGSNAGVNWVMLTNAERWMIYKIKFGKPIDKELIYEFNISNSNGKSEKELEIIFAISKEGQENAVIDDFYANIQIKNKYIIGNLLNNPEVYSTIRKIMRKLFSDVKITDEEIAYIMANDIIKKEIIDSDESKKAKKDLEKIYKKLEKIKEKNKGIEAGEKPKANEAETSNFQPDERVNDGIQQAASLG